MHSIRALYRRILTIHARIRRRPVRRFSWLRLDSLEVRVVPATYVVTSTDDAGAGTLRQAILDANSNSGADDIEFNIASAGVQTIQPTSALPALTEAVTIDARTQPGYTDSPLIELDGSLAGTGVSGFLITSAGNSVYGFAINRFDESGVTISTASATGNIVAANFIGTDSAGTSALGNGTGVRVETGAANNTIGGETAAERNIVSGNSQRGIYFVGAGAGNVVSGNYVGVDSTGEADVGNGSDGVRLDSTEAVTVEGNVISGNAVLGVAIVASDNVIVQGNLIGTDKDGLTPIANNAGVAITSASTNATIGGTSLAERNVISGNVGSGVQITGAGATGHVVIGNLIGLGSDGDTAIGNATGVYVNTTGTNVIGGTAAGSRNIISGNSAGGVHLLTSPNTTVLGNYIGSDESGSLARGNGFGAFLQGSWGVFGGPTAAHRNVVAGSTGAANISTNVGGAGGTIQGNYIGMNAAGTANLGSGTTYGIGTNSGSPRMDVIGNLVGNAVYAIHLPPNVGGSTVRGNLIGTNFDGSANLNVGFGVIVPTANNIIGGTTAADRNIILAGTGIIVEGAAATNNTISGNWLGVYGDGNTTANTMGEGVLIRNGASGTIIGGYTPTPGTAPGNVIAGTTGNAISLSATAGDNSLVIGNLIGLGADGSTDLATTGFGVRVNWGYDAVIGGDDDDDGTSDGVIQARNVISGFGNSLGGGIVLSTSGSTLGTVIRGNFIGTNAAGTAARPNYVGVSVGNSPGTIVGGTTAGAGNLISGNFIGVYTAAGGASTIQGNWIGTNAAGTGAIANTTGVLFTTANNVLGGTAAGAANIISGNSGYGVEINGAGVTGNLIQGNRIGTDPAGNSAIPNNRGIHIVTSATNNTIDRNQVSGNSSTGIVVENAPSNLVVGNLVGTKADGLSALANTGGGVWFFNASNNTLGGDAPVERNVISGNTQGGVFISGASSTGNRVVGNYVGLGSDGSTVVPNSFSSVGNPGDGIRVYGGASGNFIGGTASGEGNVISGNANAGVRLHAVSSASSNTLVIGNLIGTDKDGLVAKPNSIGVLIEDASNSNTIGGATEAARNIISGNTRDGIRVNTASSNVIQGNYIGTDISGDIDLGNGEIGIHVTGSSFFHSILRNVVSGNEYAGIGLTGVGDIIRGNYIGTNADGDADLGNSGAGIGVGSDAIVGGTNPEDRNVISGNANTGLSLYNAHNVVVQGNYIGTNAAGTAAMPNYVGIRLDNHSSNNTIGGNVAGAGNLISGNLQEGVLLMQDADSNVVAGNRIGTNADANAPIPNAWGVTVSGYSGGWGVHIDNVRIGTNSDGIGDEIERNIISGNAIAGIAVSGDTTDFARNTVIAGNYIGTNLAGTSAIPNGAGLDNTYAGIYLGNFTTNTIVGGTEPVDANLISGNSGTGVSLQFAGNSNNLVIGNRIGTNALGTGALPNTLDGVHVSGGAHDNTIGSSFNIFVSDFSNQLVSRRSADGGAQNGGVFGGLVNPSDVQIGPDGNVYVSSHIGNTVKRYDPRTGAFLGTLVSAGAEGLNGALDFLFLNGEILVTSYYTNQVLRFDADDGAYLGVFASLTTPTNPIVGPDGKVYIGSNSANRIKRFETDGTPLGDFTSGTAPQSGIDGFTFGPDGQLYVASYGNNRINRYDGTTGMFRDSVVVGVGLSGPTDVHFGPDGAFYVANYLNGTIARFNMAGQFLGTVATGLGQPMRVLAVDFAPNIIAGNTRNGVTITGAGTSGNILMGSYVGVDASGQTALPNGAIGVEISGGASANDIGGVTGGRWNLISHGNVNRTNIRISGTGTNSNRVLGNFIGSDASGLLRLGDGAYGIGIDVDGGASAHIGGDAPGAGNVIVDNGQGVLLRGGSAVDVAGNIVGLGADGSTVLHNLDGITLEAMTGTIGGTTSADRNIIGGNFANGIIVAGAGADKHIFGNYIGTDVTGKSARSNFFSVSVSGSGVTIGGSGPGEGNVISGSFQGIRVNAVADTLVIGNLIGTDPSGTAAVANGDGISLQPGATGTLIVDNVISGNSVGIVSSADSNFIEGTVIQGNLIGLDITGGLALGNTIYGIGMSGSNNTLIGGLHPYERNVISGNGLAGIRIGNHLYPGRTTTDTRIIGNTIGLNQHGVGAIPNGIGIEITSGPTDTTVGGSTNRERNVISGNSSHGVLLTGADTADNVVLGNILGAEEVDHKTAAWYLADGNTTDEIDQHTAALVNGATYAPGIDGQAFSFDGVDDYVNVGNSSDFDFVDFTLDAWIYVDPTTNVGGRTIISRDSFGSANREQYGLFSSGTGPQGNYAMFEVNRDLGGGGIVTASTPFTAGWHHVAGVRQGTTLSLYVDGILEGSASIAYAGTIAPNAPLLIGHASTLINVETWHFKGMIDEPAVTGRALSNTEIQSIYNRTFEDRGGNLGNAGDGVRIENGAHDNTIGGTSQLLVSNYDSDNVLRFSGATGDADGPIISGGGLDVAYDVEIGPDGDYYVSSRGNSKVLRYDGRTGAFKDVFIPATGNDAANILFTSDGHLLVLGYYTNNVRRFDAATGAFVDEFISGAGLSGPAGMAIGPDGLLYVTSSLSASVRKYNTSTGAFVGEFATNAGPTGLAFGPDGTLYVGSTAGNKIERFNGTTGALISTFAAGGSLNEISDLQFGPDGLLYVVNYAGNTVSRFSLDGTDLGPFVTAADGLDAPVSLLFTTAPGNLISGNSGSGVHLTGSGSSNIIQGNFIGTDSAGTAALSNSGYGVLNNAGGTTIGGTAAGAGNVISGNTLDGIWLLGPVNTVEGNRIGTDVSGTLAIGNAQGIRLQGADNTIGGTAAGARNVISGNRSVGISIAAASGNQVQGNYIGVNIDGTAPLPNQGNGIDLRDGSNNNMIGGTAAGAGNVISGNTGSGLQLGHAGAFNNFIEGNRIGTDAAGTAAIGNSGSGVSLSEAANNTVGGTVAQARNIISGNLGGGVSITGANAAGNFIQGNWIGLSSAGTALANAVGVLVQGGAHDNTIGGGQSSLLGDQISLSHRAPTFNDIHDSAVTTVAAGSGDAVPLSASTDNSDNYIVNPEADRIEIQFITSVGFSAFAFHGLHIESIQPADGQTIEGVRLETSLAGFPDSRVSFTSNSVSINWSGVFVPNGTTFTLHLQTGNGSRNIISGNVGNGVEISGATSTGNTIAGNYIGLGADGSTAVGNDIGVRLRVSTSNNTIGGSAAGAGNVISGNADHGIEISGGTGNVVLGNLIGTDSTGLLDRGNADTGVRVLGGASGTIIGGNDANERNVIAGNAIGVGLYGTTNSQVQGNYIGTDITGLSALGNNSGIALNGSGDQIGGLGVGERNVISGNASSGITNVNPADLNQILGNYIGMDRLGMGPLGNLAAGIQLFQATNTDIVGNVISANATYGIRLATNAQGTELRGNYIGTDSTGLIDRGNGSEGILVQSSGNTIGGTTAAASNIISGNAQAGIVIDGDDNVVEGNRIGLNAAGNAVPNVEGISVSAGENNRIGGFTTSAGTGRGNIISGNTGAGVRVYIGAIDTVVRGNLIGLGADGNADRGNGSSGIVVNGLNTLVGGDDDDDGSLDGVVQSRNVISGNSTQGINVGTSGSDRNTRILGNYIGTNRDGDAAVGNSVGGIAVGSAPGTRIGGAAPGSGNVISGNASAGVSIYATSYPVIDGLYNTLVQGNIIGLNADGTSAIPNPVGITISNTHNLIGGTRLSERNVISGNVTDGISIGGGDAFDNVVRGNLIGTNPAGSAAIPNGGDGIALYQGASSNMIGGTTSESYELLVTDNKNGGSIRRYNAETNTFIDTFSSITIHQPQGVVYGPDGHLYVMARASSSVLKFNGETGAYIGEFITPGSGGLDNPIDMVFTNDGYALVSSVYSDQVLRYNATTGAFVDVFIPAGGVGGVHRPAGMDIGPDGNLYVSSHDSLVKRFNIQTGAFLGDFATQNLNGATSIAFGPDGNLYVPNYYANTVTRYNGATGVFIDTFVSTNLAGPDGLTFGPDGNLYVSNYNDGTVVRFKGSTGAFDSIVVPAADALSSPSYITFRPSNVRNVISGNAGNGVSIRDGSTSLNVIAGNLIGTDATGLADLGNAYRGVDVDSGANFNTIGGTTNGAGNVISGNNEAGIVLSTSENDVQGNIIGLNRTGSAAIGNGVAGVGSGVVILNGADNRIGGATPEARNIISGNQASGVAILFSGSTDNIISGNYIGTNRAGTIAIGNIGDGVAIAAGAAGNTVGGSIAGSSNVISGNSINGVFITDLGTTANTVSGNSIGTDVSGTVDLGNTVNGVRIEAGASANTLGGALAADRNVISGNNQHGVLIQGAGTDDNVLRGNYVGTNAAGGAALGNGFNGGFGGVAIFNGAQDNLVVGNVVSGNQNTNVGIAFAGTNGNRLESNFIGTNAAGTAALVNGNVGVGIFGGAENNVIGGPGVGNVISGNLGGGVILGAAGLGATGTRIEGNIIGLGVDGSTPIPNLVGSGAAQGHGIWIDRGHDITIGGTTAAQRNIISANAGSGIRISGITATANIVEGNYIGTDETGLLDRGNSGSGVLINPGATGAPHDNRIGASAGGAGNLISGNDASGVEISGSGATGNVVAGNSIGTNAAGALALGNSGSGIKISDGAQDNRVGGTDEFLVTNFGGSSGGGGSGVAGTVARYDSATGQFIDNFLSYPGVNVATDATYGPDGNLYVSTRGGPGGILRFDGRTGAFIDVFVSSPPGEIFLFTPDGHLLVGVDAAFGSIARYDAVTGAFVDTFASGGPLNRIQGMTVGPDGLLYVSSYGNSSIVRYNLSTKALVDVFANGGSLAGPAGLGFSPAGDLFVASYGNARVLRYNLASPASPTIFATVNGVTDVEFGPDGSVYVVAHSAGTIRRFSIAGTLLETLGGSGLNGPNSIIFRKGGGNLISGNVGTGVEITGTGTTGNLVAGNLIGTNAAGAAAMGNKVGVTVSGGASNNIIGGKSGARNVISGNRQDSAFNAGGIWVRDAATSHSQVIGNYVGLDASGLNDLGNEGHGIVTSAASSTLIAGNVSSGNQYGGYTDWSGVSTRVEGNFFGTDRTGLSVVPNSFYGIALVGNSATIGGETPEKRNIISGNTGNGIYVEGGSSNYRIIGNYIGVDRTGAAALANSAHGISLRHGGISGIQIGGLNPGEGNVVSGNGSTGISAPGADHFIEGNLIGTNAAGSAAIANLGGGVGVAGSRHVTIRGNTISGNNSFGISAAYTANGEFTTDLAVVGNHIGVDPSGSIAIANTGLGIELASRHSIIGGLTAADRNIISGNTGHGIAINQATWSGFDNRIEGNYIGVDAAGTAEIGNGGEGIFQRNGDAEIVDNVISGNTNGVRIEGNGVAADLSAYFFPFTGFSIDYLTWQFSSIVNGATTAAGRDDFVFQFDGADDYVDAGNLAGSDFGTGDFSAAFWINTTQNSVGTDRVLFNKQSTSGSRRGYEAYLSGASAGRAGFVIGDGSSPEARVESSRAVNDGAWHHVAVVKTASELRLYIDGVFESLTNHSVGSVSNTQPFRMGQASDGVVTGRGFAGQLDDVGLFDTAISPATIANIAGSLNLQRVSSATVTGNIIGLGADGTADLGGNALTGIAVLDSKRNAIDGNTISGNAGVGVLLSGSSAMGNVIQGNRVGTDINGGAARGNEGSGIRVEAGASGNMIGGTLADQGNRIVYNLGAGIVVAGSSSVANAIRGNSMWDPLESTCRHASLSIL